MLRIRAQIEYDGSRYHGFQIQHNAPTIQGQIQKSIKALTGEEVSILAASRTDAGVHALGQVIAFNTASSIPPDKWAFALNSVLPEDIRVVQSCQADPDFHPRFDALGKKYRYLIYRREPGKTFYRNTALCNIEPLNIKEMQKACSLLIGRHNFKAFCASGSSAKTFEREITMCHLIEQGPFLILEIAADAFLYNMVRIIMGTIMDIGRNYWTAEKIKEIIASQDRTKAGATAPPQGLYLIQVYYKDK
ncbi:MAG: tRNA pseudouridine(38-40) synthase TruA [Syntrophomonadaceae bacterium]|jgi:tRNA pseudouridine38-40 synthase